MAALANLSLLSITSKHKDYRSHNSLLLHHGRVLARNCPARPEQRLHAFDHGTRATVRDLFGSMPVRVKHRYLTGLQRSYLNRGWSQIRLCVTALLLAWPSRVTVVLREGPKGYGLRLQNDTSLDVVTRLPQLLRQANLLPSESSGRWIPISATSRRMAVTGCFSTSPAPSRCAQFISIGLQPLQNTHLYSVLYEEVNKAFKASDFGAEAQDELYRDNEQERELAVNGRRAADRWPMFHLHFRASQLFADGAFESFDSSRSLDVIVDLTRAVSHGFLRSQKCESIKKPNPSDGPRVGPVGAPSWPQLSESLQSSKKSNAQAPFDSWSRVKVGVPSRRRKLADFEQKSSKQRLVGNGGVILSRPFPEPLLKPHETKPDPSRSFQASLHASYPTNNHEISAQTLVESQAERPITLTTRATRACTEMEKGHTNWAHDISRAWENPIFEAAENAIPYLRGANSERSHHWMQTSDHETSFETASVGICQKISKSGLTRAEVVSQVDQKFVLIKVPVSVPNRADKYQPTTLVLLDQHAADERCRLEELMSSYFQKADGAAFSPVLEILDKPLIYDLSRRETELFEEYKQRLGNWGIVYTVKEAHVTDEPAEAAAEIRVTALPPSIAERCRTEPRLLIDLLRKEVWRLNDDRFSIRGESSSLDKSSYPWMNLFRDCPQGILELLHSRSCRSKSSNRRGQSDADTNEL